MGKSPEEKAAYIQFLQSDTDLKPTESPKENLRKTNVSSFEDEGEQSPPQPPQRKSLWLKIRDLDFLKNDYGRGITIAVLATILGLLIWG